MDVFPSASKSVPVSAVVRLAAVEEGVLGVRNLNSADCASSLFLTVELRPKVRPQYIYHHTVKSLVASESQLVFVICE